MANEHTTTLTPFLTVSDAKKAVDFYVSAFGATEMTRFDLPQDKISSKISIDGALFYVADEEPEFGNVSPAASTATAIRIILETEKADDLFAKAIAWGATEICPMTTEDDWRIGKLKDPFGHVWELGYTV
ncbi:VOC family protein [Larkinella terrae]|uniref:VOC family protein n=1 Tax=Larkinella terrae TaxID=2025311 RepID=A0A7K0EJW1_9BACT|nr:VOC family protein [Larkinella terrae]MRS62150.1 VOC family protein [Larkinella terrae]